METIIITTYLEMKTKPSKLNFAPPTNNCLVVLIQKPTVPFYRFLYNSVGRDYRWLKRQKMSDEELRKVVQNEKVEIYILYVGSEIAGYAELDRRIINEIELAYFGLFPEFIGRGLGQYLLQWIIQKAWEYVPKRLWVHTCNLDHPAALPNYLKANFEIYDTQIEKQEI